MRPLRWTASGGSFDRLPGVVVLILSGANCAPIEFAIAWRSPDANTILATPAARKRSIAWGTSARISSDRINWPAKAPSIATATEKAEEFVAVAVKSEAACLVVDMQLGGMSGLELGYQLSAMGLSLPIIFVTASQDKKIHHAALEFGCVAYLPKPFGADVLAKAIADAMG